MLRWTAGADSWGVHAFCRVCIMVKGFFYGGARKARLLQNYVPVGQMASVIPSEVEASFMIIADD